MRGFHAARRLTDTSPQGCHVLRLGASVGYWPCLRAVFAQVALGASVFEVWYGDDSYKKKVKG